MDWFQGGSEKSRITCFCAASLQRLQHCPPCSNLPASLSSQLYKLDVSAADTNSNSVYYCYCYCLHILRIVWGSRRRVTCNTELPPSGTQKQLVSKLARQLCRAGGGVVKRRSALNATWQSPFTPKPDETLRPAP